MYPSAVRHRIFLHMDSQSFKASIYMMGVDWSISEFVGFLFRNCCFSTHTVLSIGSKEFLQKKLLLWRKASRRKNMKMFLCDVWKHRFNFGWRKKFQNMLLFRTARSQFWRTIEAISIILYSSLRWGTILVFLLFFRRFHVLKKFSCMTSSRSRSDAYRYAHRSKKSEKYSKCFGVTTCKCFLTTLVRQFYWAS